MPNRTFLLESTTMSEEIQQQTQSPVQMPPLPSRLGVHDIRNSDLVSRYMAATPPYLYSSPVGPQTFFFSDMLRSIVQSRNNEQAARNANNTSTVPSSGPHVRRSRKRAWGQSRTLFDPPAGKDHKLQSFPTGKPHNIQPQPLELTNKCQSPILAFNKNEPLLDKMHPDVLKGLPNVKHSMGEFPQTVSHNNNNNHIISDSGSMPSGGTTPSSDLVLPPPPPMWYPPLYPPYGIDPLHFFIDLRVSGHIYDRKKENTSPNSNPTAHNSSLDDTNSGKRRMGSAFSVPTSRREKSPSSRALNLTSTSPTGAEKQNPFNFNHSAVTSAEKDLSAKNNANYVLQNLPRIYTDLTTQIGVEERNSINSDETNDSKSDLDAQDESGLMASNDEPGGVEGFDAGDRDDDSNDVVIVDNKSSIY